MLQHTGLRRSDVIPADGGAENQVQLLWPYPRALQRLAAGGHQQLGQRLVGADRPLPDAGALADPLVAGVQKGGEVVVAFPALGQGAAG